MRQGQPWHFDGEDDSDQVGEGGGQTSKAEPRHSHRSGAGLEFLWRLAADE